MAARVTVASFNLLMTAHLTVPSLVWASHPISSHFIPSHPSIRSILFLPPLIAPHLNVLCRRAVGQQQHPPRPQRPCLLHAHHWRQNKIWTCRNHKHCIFFFLSKSTYLIWLFSRLFHYAVVLHEPMLNVKDSQEGSMSGSREHVHPPVQWRGVLELQCRIFQASLLLLFFVFWYAPSHALPSL